MASGNSLYHRLRNALRQLLQRRQVQDRHDPDQVSSIIDTIPDGDGAQHNGTRHFSPVGVPSGDNRRLSQWRPSPQVFLTVAVMLLVFFVIILVMFNLGSPRGSGPSSRFVVVVAGFSSSDENETGQVVADELVRELRQQSEQSAVTIKRVRSVPTDPDMALQLATERDADVLVWGEVAQGALLDAPSLSPRLVYTPDGPYGPNGWIGYAGRFSMPRHYLLADAPINGKAVLPELLAAVAAYNVGNADAAFDELSRVMEEYPLNASLPRMLRGNVLWARNAYAQAADEYRCASGRLPADVLYCQPAQPSGLLESERALPANNLGAILIDAGDDQAEWAMLEAGQLLAAGHDFGELRFNWGLWHQQQGNWDAAIQYLESARTLLPNNAAVLLALAEAYREAAQYDLAGSTLRLAERHISRQAARVPAQQRALFTRHLRAVSYEQQGLLRLARLLNAYGPITWELEVAAPRSPEQFTRVYQDLQQAVSTSQSVVTDWRALAAAHTSSESEVELVAVGQAERADSHLNRQQYHLSLVMIEQERMRPTRSANVLDHLQLLLFDKPLPEAPGVATVEDLLDAKPRNAALLIAYGRALRMVTDYDPTVVAQVYDRIIDLEPERPDGYYGRAWLALDRGRIASAEARTRARDYLRDALQQHGAYYPARLRLVEIARYEQDFSAALVQLDILLAQRANDPAILLRFGDTLKQQGDLDTAQEAYGAMLAQHPDSAEAYFALAQIQYSLGDAATALEHVNRAVTIRPNYADALFLQGRLLLEQNRTAAAFRTLQHAVDAGLRDIDAVVMIGNWGVQHNQPRLAIDAFNYALQVQPRDQGQPDDPRIHHGLGQAYLALDDPQRAAEHEQQALDLMTQIQSSDQRLRAEMLVGLADAVLFQAYPDRQQRDRALNRADELYDQALLLDPGQVDAQLGKGKVDGGRGNWKMAKQDFEQALMFPQGGTDPQVYYWIAEALLRQPELADTAPGAAYQQDVQEILAYYDQAMVLQSDFPQALLGKAHAYLALDERDTALQSLNQALDMNEDYAEAWLLRGKILQEMGRVSEALQAYNTAIQANDALAETYYRRGLIYVQRDNYDRAMHDFEQAVRLEQNLAEAPYWLGRAHFVQDEVTEARRTFATAVAVRGGQFTKARFYQGIAEFEMGDYEAARSSFQAVVKAYDGRPLDSLARLAQAHIEQIDQSFARGAIPGIR